MEFEPPLPRELRFLASVLRQLAKSEAGENDDRILSSLERALRKRVRGMEQEQAIQRLIQDRETLETWLHSFDSKDHVAHFVRGYLSRSPVRLAGGLLEASPPLPKGPQIHLTPAAGWRVKVEPFSLNVRKGALFAGIQPFEQCDAERFCRQNEALLDQPGFEQFEVRFGPVEGKKFVKQRYQIDYVLSIPGGYVVIQLFSTVGGRQIKDETPFEAQLHTLSFDNAATGST